jgi:hypothetical protein
MLEKFRKADYKLISCVHLLATLMIIKFDDTLAFFFSQHALEHTLTKIEQKLHICQCMILGGGGDRTRVSQPNLSNNSVFFPAEQKFLMFKNRITEHASQSVG